MGGAGWGGCWHPSLILTPDRDQPAQGCDGRGRAARPAPGSAALATRLLLRLPWQGPRAQVRPRAARLSWTRDAPCPSRCGTFPYPPVPRPVLAPPLARGPARSLAQAPPFLFRLPRRTNLPLGPAPTPPLHSGSAPAPAPQGALTWEEEAATTTLRTLQPHQHEAAPDPAPQAEATQGRR